MVSSASKIKLLFITQKIHQRDDDLAFVILWIKEFIKQGADVQVICLEKGIFDESFPVYSLGKERGAGKIARILKFLKLIFSLKYDRVFVHMNAEYFTLGGWYWFIKGIPAYLWYTHYAMHIHLWLAGIFSRRMFAATAQSLPQYNKNPKKIITGHGIDIDFWLKNSETQESSVIKKEDLCSIFRICRSKRLELGILSLKYLPPEYNLTIYGRDVEGDYYQEIQALIGKENLTARVHFKGPIPMAELKNVYPGFRIMINMASETIDKTMLEGMLFGIYPVTTAGNSQAIGLPVWPAKDSPEDIARFVSRGEWKKYDKEYLQNIVRKKHGLSALIGKMLTYINEGR